MSNCNKAPDFQETDLGKRPLDELLAELRSGRRALSAQDIDALRARPDLSGSAERLALLDRAVESAPGGALRVADDLLARWLLESLTKDRFQKGQAVFRRIWAGAESAALSELARQGLDKMGERTARQAKELDKALAQGAIRWDPHHPSPLAAAVAGVFDLAAETAFDRLGHLLSAERVASETGAQIAKDILAYAAHRSSQVAADARWLRAIAPLARDPRLKVAAKQALATFNPASVRAAMEGSGAAPAAPTKAPRPPVPATVDYLPRYMAGEHEAVWRELLDLGETVRDPAVLPVAEAVARETMGRVRANVEKIVLRLREHGYKLRNPKKALAALGADVAKHVASLEKIAGHSLPLSLRAFWETVGAIDLTEHGSRAYREDELTFEMLGKEDPLMVCPPKDALDFAKAWQKEAAAGMPELREPLALYIAPGRGWKASPDVGDDAPCWMKLAGATADAPVGSGPDAREPFVAFLRRTILTSGGFAGLAERGGDPAWPGLAILTADLQPF